MHSPTSRRGRPALPWTRSWALRPTGAPVSEMSLGSAVQTVQNYVSYVAMTEPAVSLPYNAAIARADSSSTGHE